MADLELAVKEAPPNLELEGQYPVIIPSEVRKSKLFQQRPHGEKGDPKSDVVYIDARNPNTAIVIDANTWGPKLNRGKPVYLDVSGIVGRTFAAIIYHTPPRTPEKSFTEEIGNVAGLLRRTSEKENKIITGQHVGVLFIVEDKGKDTIKQWREQFLRNIGIVVPQEKEHPAILETETSEFIISQGRLAMQHGPVNLYESRAGSFVSGTIGALEKEFSSQGIDVDSSQIKAQSKASSVPPETLSRVKGVEGRIFRDRTTGDITEVIKGAIFHSESNTGREERESQKIISKQKSRERLPSYPLRKPFMIEAEGQVCGDCAEHLWGKLKKGKSGKTVLERWCPNHREWAKLPDISPSVLGRFTIRK